MNKTMRFFGVALVVGLGLVARGADSTEVSATVKVSLCGIYADGSSIDGTLTLGYAPTESQNAVVKVNDEEVVNESEAGSITWSAPMAGEYIISHTVGDDVLSATYIREISATVKVSVRGIYADGSSIDGTLTLGYAPTESQNAVVKVNDEEVVNESEAGSITWSAPTAGEYIISHTVGDDVLSATYIREVSATVKVSVRGIYADGSSIDGALTLGYAPTESQNAVVKVDDDVVVNASEAGRITWSAPIAGEYTVSHSVGNEVLLATYNVIKAYSSITYTNLKGATHTNPVSYEEGTEVIFAAPSAIAGYTFMCWTPSAITASMTGSQTVKANWEANSYTISYNANGGNGTMDGTACTYDTEGEVAANTFTRDGYKFMGWATEEDGAVVYEAGAKVTNLVSNQNGVITLYAVWQIESVPAPIVTPADGAAFTGDSCTVTLTCAAEGAKIYYTTNGATPKLTEKYLYTTPFTITDSVSIKAIAVYDELKSGYVTATITKKVLTLAEVLGFESVADVTLETGSDTEWKPILDATSSTGMSAQSAAIGDGEESWLKATVNGKGTFSFKWKVDCEDDPDGATWDHLEVLVDGNESDRIDGATDWAEKTITFTTEGAHTIYWAYVKDEDPSDEEGSDCAWVADCTWKEANKDPVPEVGSAADLSAALEGSADARLAENIKDVTKYAKYHAWVDKIAGTGVDHFGTRQTVKDSELAWFAYALDLSALPGEAPTNVVIETIGSAAEGGWDLDVKVGDVKVGSGASAADLGTVFSVEGAAELKEESFSAENVTTTFGAAENGKVKVEVEPKEAKGQFFIRVKMTP